MFKEKIDQFPDYENENEIIGGINEETKKVFLVSESKLDNKMLSIFGNKDEVMKNK